MKANKLSELGERFKAGMPVIPSEGVNTFRKFPQGEGSIAQFWPQGGWGRLQHFQREAPENSAEGAVLENFGDFSKKLSFKNAIKSDNLRIRG